MMLYAVYIGFFGLTFLAASSAETEAEPTLSLILAPVALLVGLVLVMTSFWALFFRKAADTFAMGELRAGFEVSSVEWLKFYAKLIGLTIVTLGLGSIMWGYLRWKFVFDRLALYGTVDLDTMTPSTTASPKDAEGFADAFDVGAF